LTLIDIAGARRLRSAAGQARQHGRRLIAVNARPEAEKWLRLMGLDRQLKLVSTRMG
jgi:anti-anti-sigma regulatory factor